MDAFFTRTSVTLDEAVGILIGWLDGPFDGEFYINEEQTETEYSTFELALTLKDEEELLESKYAEAHDDKLPADVIAKAREAVKKHRIRCSKAKKYLCEVKDEIAKGPTSELRLEKKFTDYTNVLITLGSLSEWSIGKYEIDILSPNRLPVSVQEAQAEKRAEARALLTSGTENPNIESKDSDKKPKQGKQRARYDVILAALKELEYDPKCIPKGLAGKRGARFAVSDHLAGNPLFPPLTEIFNDAWQDLRDAKRIVDGK